MSDIKRWRVWTKKAETWVWAKSKREAADKGEFELNVPSCTAEVEEAPFCDEPLDLWDDGN